MDWFPSTVMVGMKNELQSEQEETHEASPELKRIQWEK